MLNPVDTTTVIRDGAASGRQPDQIHTGVAWWMAACFVVTTETDRLAVAHDGHPVSGEYFDRLCRGAVNAQHYACRVLTLGAADESELLAAMEEAGGIPGMRVSTTTADDGDIVTVALYDRDGQPLTETAGLAVIRQMIAEDRVPIPVNDTCKGTVEPYAATMGAGR
ncbi:hypothetical protein [Streptomyces sp. ISL-100]|uniref:hypothetical protein n=1 Tax=Streptomyces sp. ISL-100 TaxID=2819173 RepID=UPI001BEB3221|nr:hypothetical protein [Streptomyces sp. ISL-100]MBT2395646.1 hypothetical protein [Streptomyces sp. ISL-100]